MPFHDKKRTDATPSQIVRSRFSAFVYGLVSFITESTHPTNKDYVTDEEKADRPTKRSKKQIWEKSIRSFAQDFEFANLSFESESDDDSKAANSDLAIVSIKLERRLRNVVSFDSIEEKIRLKRGVNGQWLYLGSDMINKGSALNPAKPQRMISGSLAKTGFQKNN